MKSSRLMTFFRKVLPSYLPGIFTIIRSELDNEFHAIINEKQFGELGHIYYNLGSVDICSFSPIRSIFVAKDAKPGRVD